MSILMMIIAIPVVLFLVGCVLLAFFVGIMKAILGID
jgi:nitrogen fixation-related uncharacterized protein